MKQIGVVTLEDVQSKRNRIGDNQRSDSASKSIEIEKILLSIPSPLPITFDIRPIHDYYFSEFSYHDIFGGLVICTMNPEITARIVDHVFHAEEDIVVENHCKKLEKILFDKYVLNTTLQRPEAKKIIFLPGSNLMNALDRELIDRIMFNNEDVYLKLHPITGQEMIRQLGIKYGYYRLLSTEESGIEYLKQAEEVFTTCNSEIGIYAAALGKKFMDITSFECMAELTYWSMYRLFVPGNLEHNKLVVNKILSSKGSGWILPWHTDIEDRINEYFNRAMMLRQFFKPLAPKVNRTRLKSVPIPDDKK